MLALEPEPHRVLAGAALDDALTVVADFTDLKSPFMGGHCRRCAPLTADAGEGGAWTRRRPPASPGSARPRLRYDRGAQLDLGQARLADARRSSTGSSCTRW